MRLPIEAIEAIEAIDPVDPIDRQHARAWLRRQRPEWLSEVARRRTPSLDPSELAERAELRDRIWVHLLELPERQREAVVLHEMEGLSYPEIADRWGTTASTVRAHAHAARQALQRKLREWTVPER